LSHSCLFSLTFKKYAENNWLQEKTIKSSWILALTLKEMWQCYILVKLFLYFLSVFSNDSTLFKQKFLKNLAYIFIKTQVSLKCFDCVELFHVLMTKKTKNRKISCLVQTFFVSVFADLVKQSIFAHSTDIEVMWKKIVGWNWTKNWNFVNFCSNIQTWVELASFNSIHFISDIHLTFHKLALIY
jgi:hypothetical protein